MQDTHPFSESSLRRYFEEKVMDDATFISYCKPANTIAGEYGFGYRMGLLNKFFGDKCLTYENIETLSSQDTEYGEGLRHGLAGLPPSSKYISKLQI